MIGWLIMEGGVGRTDGEECTEAESCLIGREREEMMVIRCEAAR
jgi:hypothetical protein